MKLKYNIIVLFLLACLTSSFGQDCYQVEVDHVGAGAFYHDLLEVVSCELNDSITKNTNDDFKVLAYNLYPVLGAVDKTVGINGTLQKIDEDLANKSNYLAIIKKINFEHDPYSTTPSHSIEYILKLNLPDNENNQLSDLDQGALLEVLHSQAKEDIERTGNTVVTEAAIMQKLAKSLNGLTTAENLEIMGYTFVPSESEDQIESSTLSVPNGDQFASIRLKNDAGSYNEVSELLNLSQEDAELNFKMHNQDLGFTVAIANGKNLITSNNQTLDQAFVEAEKLVDDQVNIHVHHDEARDGLYFKFGFTENTAIQLLETITTIVLFDAGYTLNEGGGYTVKGETQGLDSRSSAEDWNYAKRFMNDSNFDILFPEGTKYGGGIACGLVDGLLSSIELIWDLAKGISEAGSGFLSSTFSYFKEVYKEGCKNGILAAGSKLSKDTIAAGTKFYENVKSAVTFIRGALYNLTYDQIKSFMKTMYESVKEWFGTLLSLTKEGGYEVGKIAFDVILNFFTAGAASGAKAAKYLDKIMKLLKKWDLDNIAHNIAGMLRSAEDLGTQAKKIFKCKILGKGCFVKDTPVLMANNPFRLSNLKPLAIAATMPLVAPIQNVQVDDMVKSYHHEDAYLSASAVENDVYVPGWQDYDYLDITPESWQVGKFIIREDDGRIVEIKANRPKKWFEDYGLENKGDEAFIFIEEMGISDYAVLQSIRPTKIDTRVFALNEKGQVDRPVITTYKRIADEVVDYSFSNGQSISCTPNHPFYSVDRGEYVSIGELNFGEKVLSSAEREVKFIGGISREKGEPVYNFEVWRAHNYYVGSEGNDVFLLAHNACAKKILGDSEYKARKEFYKSNGYSAAEAEELVQKEALASGLIDEAIESGKYVNKGLADEIRKAASDFAKETAAILLSEVDAPGAIAQQEVTLDVELNDGTKFTIRADQMANDAGELHIGEAKYSTKEKNWDVDYKKASTKNQTKFLKALNSPNSSGKIKNLTPRGNAAKLNSLGLTHGKPFLPSKIKSYRIFGSEAGKKVLKKTLKWLF